MRVHDVLPKLFLPRPLQLWLGVGPGDVLAALEDSRVLTNFFSLRNSCRYGWVSDPVMRVRVQDAFAKTLTNFIIYSW